MAKGKNKSKKNKSVLKAVKSYLGNKRVLYSLLGGAGVGLALGATLDKDKRRAMIDKVASTVKGLNKPAAATHTDTNSTQNPAA